MKTKKLDLLDFKQNELSKEKISNVNAGAPVNGPTNPPKPGGNTVGNGAGTQMGDEICYFDFDGELMYCVPIEKDKGIVISTI
jgi:hypothetical protein